MRYTCQTRHLQGISYKKSMHGCSRGKTCGKSSTCFTGKSTILGGRVISLQRGRKGKKKGRAEQIHAYRRMCVHVLVCVLNDFS